jgi:putative peptide zinc metalloprotease protein
MASRNGRVPEALREAPAPVRPEKAEAARASSGARLEREATAPPEFAPRLAAGVELLGEYKESGYTEPPYLARRADGQTIQMPRLLYLVAESVDGHADDAEVAQRVSKRFGRRVSADNIRVLVGDKLRPLGVVAHADGSTPELAKVDPLLALTFRTVLLSERAVRAVTTVFKPFFYAPVTALVLAGLVAVDVWLFLLHGVASPMRELAYNPVLLLMVLGLVVVATALHEVGHATAARYGGAEPGVMGAGIYIVWPAFYTDVTDAYRLDRKGRLRTDLGGVYFNVLFVLAIAGAYFLTGFEALLVLVLVQHMQILQQFLPFLRLDGYYVLSDLTGVPDLFARIKPTLRSMIPGRDADKRVGELKPWVRVVVTAWVVALVPILLVVFALMVFNAPRVVATAWDSLLIHLDEASGRFGEGHVLGGLASSVQTATLVLPALGILVTLGRGGKRMLAGAWRWSDGSAGRRVFVAAATAGLVGLTTFVWWPNGEYKPIQPGEKGTLSGALRQFDELGTGRPGLTPAREKELGGAPFSSEAKGGEGDSPADAPPVTDEAEGDAPAGGRADAPTEGETPAETPTTEAPTTEAPTTEAPTTEAPPTEAPTTATPTTETPTTEAPTTEVPTTETPTTEAPTTETPTTEAPPTETPPSEAPSTGQPPTGEAPTTKPPTPGLPSGGRSEEKPPAVKGSSSEAPKIKAPKGKASDPETPTDTTATTP